jgi:dolichol-phosphate mannosyltransferase
VPRKTLSIVIPVYCNEASLPHLFPELMRLEKRLASRELGLELVFVDDGSSDSSWKVLLDFKQQRTATKIIKLTRNFGAPEASRAGLRFVTGDCFMMLAADLQDPAEKIDEMIERWEAGSKFVICVRQGRDDPLPTRLLAATFYRLIRLLSLPGYPITGFDMMIMDKVMLPLMRERSRNTSPSVYAFWLGFTPSVVTYHRPRSRFGRSRWSLSKRLKLAVDSITGFSVLPIRLLSSFGVIVALLSFAYGAFMFFSALVGGTEVKGFSTIVVLVSFFGGLILTMLGVVGEYLWRVFDTASGRPESVIDESYL